MDLFAALQNSNESATAKRRIVDVKSELQDITTMIHDLSKKLDSDEMIGDIIESELAGMDKAIEEAAARIEVSVQVPKSYRMSDFNFFFCEFTGNDFKNKSIRFGYKTGSK